MARFGLSTAQRDSEHPLVEEQLVDTSRVREVEVIPGPAEAVPRIRKGVASALQSSGHVANIVGAQRVGHGTKRLHDVAAHVIAHRRIAASDHDEVAAEYATFDRAPSGEHSAELVLRTEQRERDGSCHDLLVRRGHEQLARIARIDRVAPFRVDDEDAPMRIAELRLRDQ